MTPSAPMATASRVPDTSAAAVRPHSSASHTTVCPTSRDTRPAAIGRSAAGRFTRSAGASYKSLATLPAAPSAMPESAAKASSLGTATVPSAIHPPATTPAAASSRLCARSSRQPSSTQGVLVQLLVQRHHLIGVEPGGPGHGPASQGLEADRVAEHLDG